MSDAPPGALMLRPMTEEDVERAGALAREAGRNVSAADYARFLPLEGARGFVLERDGRIVGAATVMRYFEHAFVGPVVLREASDGLVIALLARIVEAMQREGVTAFEAEAGDAEEPVLARMGFAAARRTLVLERAPGRPRAAQGGSVAMREEHALDVGSLDAAAVGFGRKEYLLSLMREMPEGARVLERGGDVVGFALVRRAPRGYALGPVVTRSGDAGDAEALVLDALAAAPDAPVVMLAPEGSSLADALGREGFARVGTLTRMRAGTRDADPEPATEWAVGSRMTG